MEDKNPSNGYEKPSFHILNLSNFQMLHNMHFSNHLDTATDPPPFKQGWDEETLLGQGKVYRGAQTTTLLGGEGEGRKN